MGHRKRTNTSKWEYDEKTNLLKIGGRVPYASSEDVENIVHSSIEMKKGALSS
jgi:hypothetical protein